MKRLHIVSLSWRSVANARSTYFFLQIGSICGTLHVPTPELHFDLKARFPHSGRESLSGTETLASTEAPSNKG